MNRPLLPIVTVALLLWACDVGQLPKDPTTAPSSWPSDPNPPDLIDPFAAAGGSSCAAVIETSKRLGCGFEADDPAAWCAARTAKERSCMSAAKNCLAQRMCKEASK